jgi:site-specific DNA recombinase
MIDIHNLVAVYARVSSEDQAERETIENQVDFALKYCDLHQIQIYDWYKDDGISGTISLENRDEGKRLLEDAKQGKFKLVLIYNLKRLGRKARIILNAVHELEQYGVHVRSMTEPFDTSDANGRFLLTVLAGVAELDRETMLDTLWHGANRAARKGKWLGGIVPYGYFVNEAGYLEINENPIPNKDISEAGLVRLIYYLIAEKKYSTIKVADYLNLFEYPTSYTKDGRLKKGKRKEKTAGIWSPGAISRIIKNTTYMGIHHYGKRATRKREIITREVPAIVSVEQWEKAQKVLEENQIEAFRNTKNTKYLLRGLIKCGTCGLNYHGIGYPSGKHVPGTKRAIRYYYQCGGKHKYHGAIIGRCPSKNIPAEWIENLIWSYCEEFIKNPGEVIEELRKERETKSSKNSMQKELILKEIETINKAISDKENGKQSILDLFRKNLISNLDVEKQLQKIAIEKEQLEMKIKELEASIKIYSDSIQQVNSIDDILKELREKIGGQLTFEVKREIIKKLVSQITVIANDDKVDNKPKFIVVTQFFFNKEPKLLSTRSGIDRSQQ